MPSQRLPSCRCSDDGEARVVPPMWEPPPCGDGTHGPGEDRRLGAPVPQAGWQFPWSATPSIAARRRLPHCGRAVPAVPGPPIADGRPWAHSVRPTASAPGKGGNHLAARVKRIPRSGDWRSRAWSLDLRTEMRLSGRRDLPTMGRGCMVPLSERPSTTIKYRFTVVLPRRQVLVCGSPQRPHRIVQTARSLFLPRSGAGFPSLGPGTAGRRRAGVEGLGESPGTGVV